MWVRQVGRTEDSLEDFIFDTVSAALRQWDVSLSEVDSVVTASSDQLDGRSISAMVTGASAGGYRRDLINLSSGSEHALYYQAARVMAGRTRVGLVVTWGKPSETPLPVLDRLSHEPFFARPIGHERSGDLGLEVAAIRARYEPDPAAAQAVAAKNAANARANPRAVVFGAKAELPPDVDSIGWHPPADACVVLLLGPAAGPSRGPGVRIAGMGMATGGSTTESQLRPWEALELAASRAYARAGVGDPLEELDFAEVCDITPWHELMAYDALGLTGERTASALALTGATRRDGALPVNPSGGIAAGDCDFAVGLVRVGEGVLQLLGAAGPVSVAGRRCVIQASSRSTSQIQSVFVLEREG